MSADERERTPSPKLTRCSVRRNGHQCLGLEGHAHRGEGPCYFESARDATYSWNELQACRRETFEAAANEAERQIIEYAEIDVLDTTPERLRIARRIRALATPHPQTTEKK